MKLSGNTILITGGATGIGLEMAKAFLKSKSTVIICGRRAERLEQVKKDYPDIHVKTCDVAEEKDRLALVDWVIKNFSDINVLVNNAGIQRDIDLVKGAEDLKNKDDEIKINLEAPIKLTALMISHLLKQKESAIINVSSGLGFVPSAKVPIYSATKAALHSYTMSLRHQLKNSGIKVFEVIPPIVDTELNPEGYTNRSSAPKADEFVVAVMKALENQTFEIGYGLTTNFNQASKADLDKVFQNMNR